MREKTKCKKQKLNHEENRTVTESDTDEQNYIPLDDLFDWRARA